MSIYNFVPQATHTQNHPFVTWDDAFSDEEIEKIKAYCENLPKNEASVGGYENSPEAVRKSEVAWVSNNNEIGWLYDRLAYIGRNLNSKFYGFDLTGFVEDFQYATYTEDDQGHYTWHNDMSDTSASSRKFTLVLQLSDPSEYEGGDLETFIGVEPGTVDKKKGMIAGFPSWTLHRVTPVTKGIRKSLVVWIAGPQFK
jgi:PKHD-type hydroxylase